MLTLEDILAATGGHLDGSSGMAAMMKTEFSCVATDSRGLIAGALFVALPGENVDGHTFVVDAVGHGASGALVNREWQPPDALPSGVALIRTDDTLGALQKMAAWWRDKHKNIQVIGITGSVGKTSTKEVTAAVLSSRFKTLKNLGNLNNEIGLPLTLLQLTESHRKAVLEMGGGYALGELTLLSQLAKQDISVVTNVKPVHLERMGTIENIALNKSEIVRALPPSGTAILNGDDPLVLAMREATEAKVVTYGLEDRCDLQASNIEGHGLAGVHFTLHERAEGGRWRVRLPLLGRHSVHTALAAAGVARAAGMTWDEIIQALQKLDAQIRLIVVPGYNGSILIDDSYNASPDSTIAALNLLDDMKGNRIAVLGDMLELGSYEQEGHLKVARRASVVANRLVVVGTLGRVIGEEALRVGMAPERVFFASDNEQVVDYLKRVLKQGDYVLVKGSRGLRMEQIVDGLKA